MNNTDKIPMNKRSEYGYNFWNYIKGSWQSSVNLHDKDEPDPFYYRLPAHSEDEYEKAVSEISLFRRLATVFRVYGGSSEIITADSDDTVQVVAENGPIQIKDVTSDFTPVSVICSKLAVILKLPCELMVDAAFDLKGYMVKRLAKSYASAEDNVFINGSGEDEPEGLLKGAETSHTATELTFDDIIRLFFSVKPEYRENGIWLMNDETAQKLRTLKDDAGNYLWNQANDTILGRPVFFSRHMPSTGKPVAFGDLSYYWVIGRSPLTVRLLRELFALNGQNGYLTYELIDGKLVRPEAVKTIAVGE